MILACYYVEDVIFIICLKIRKLVMSNYNLLSIPSAVGILQTLINISDSEIQISNLFFIQSCQPQSQPFSISWQRSQGQGMITASLFCSLHSVSLNFTCISLHSLLQSLIQLLTQLPKILLFSFISDVQ